MFESLKLFRIADALARHSGARQSELARNVANADTPRFRAMDIEPFAMGVEDESFTLRHRSSGHTPESIPQQWQRRDAPDGMAPNGNTVSIEEQMLKAAEVRQAHETALAVYTSSLTILRSSLGGR